ncbi:hypothetical protein SOVF_073440 [Spinacia oleracea]|uniref:Phosphatidic acid phosphatase type 2/haloperoxidase domain-containing protein n=1 Tax=Spinacia oleracea TaxID=3562 RepID=A0A9R0IC55_SPIOL|nr:uncharacterized protein LOC110786321 [Spinacia oleracea]KNA18164.1 hypothetical protein SOVF_073440 [Spinacia oleracea]
MKSAAIKPFSSPSFNQKIFNPKNNPYQRAISLFSSSFFRAKPKPPKRAICVSCKLPINEPLNPFSLLVPVLQSVKNFTAKTAKFNWGSFLKDPVVIDEITGGANTKSQFLHNGGVGMALLTVQSTARDRFSPIVATLAANPTFMSGLLACFLAQSIKVLLDFCVERRWNLRMFCSSGGMPSSHSALCTAITTSVALCHGVADALFPICLGFSLIVMYDATGVRRHAGMQAEVLNKIIEDLFQGHPISERKLKELLGHTPSQVFAGALLGIAVACFCCQGCMIAI